MDIIKIIGVALTGVIMLIIIKQYKPEFSIYISLAASLIIVFLFVDKLAGIVSFINNFSENITRKQRIHKHFNKNYRRCNFDRVCSTEFVKM